MPPVKLGDKGLEKFKFLREENYLGILSPSSAGGITHAARRASSVLIREQRSFNYEIGITKLQQRSSHNAVPTT
jgi:hypothetical protein